MYPFTFMHALTADAQQSICFFVVDRNLYAAQRSASNACCVVRRLLMREGAASVAGDAF